MRFSTSILAIVIGAAGLVTSNQAQAIIPTTTTADSFPYTLPLNEPDTVIWGTGGTLKYTISGNLGTLDFNADNGFDFVQDASGPIFPPFFNPTYHITAVINLDTKTLVSGNLEIGTNPIAPTVPSAGDSPFFSSDITGFGTTGSGSFEFSFIQEDKPVTGTDTTYAPLGNTVGAFLFLDAGTGFSPADGSAFDLDTEFGNDPAAPQLADAKTFDSGPNGVPEPLSTVLIGAALGSLAIRATGRRSKVQ